MRHKIVIALLAGGTMMLSACAGRDGDVARALSGEKEQREIDEIMLSVAPPQEAVAFFRKRLAEEPGEITHQRGLASALVRSKKASEGARVWQEVASNPNATNEDLVNFADAQIRTSDWAGAKATLDAIPPTHESFERYRLEAMVADSQRDWKRADSFYETAVGLTTTPANVLNNWGYSKLSRGDTQAAERLFAEALTYDRTLFTAKNNLVLARATRRAYALPGIPMSQEERAQLLHTAALAAIKQGDTDIGRNLLEDAIDTHPRHFEAAVRALQAMSA
ncbi:tetratricopeptide repeat protein [Jannaschia aquimarina]|uniref:Tetratricopeptide repeat protein n=1 Tax=Jannaschia aquimarina TaxID=935700 RepID=A0A0D1D9F7_9RHOB|nr:hypothetical protein [Jannaschia aquimarina]KIT16528.1 Tetratricopeptide repeat protein [Jannaschia aquimarina]SNT06433.1 Flp pilus assembly protein TadD, contains TPR repeats [Jannaschia aquimarina]